MFRRKFLSFFGLIPVMGAGIPGVAGVVRANSSQSSPTGKLELLEGVSRAPQSKLRVWKLGRLDANHKLFPTKEAIDALADMLRKWDGKGDIEIIWGPDLEVTQFDADTNGVEIVAGPGIRLCRDGKVIKVEAEPVAPGEDK
jgi:hypothetical protein